MRRLLVPLVALSVSLPSAALAARTASPDQPIPVRLEVLQPTAVTFPEPVGSLASGLAEGRLSADYDGPHLFLQAMDPTVSGRLFVVGQSGKLYTLLFAVKSPADDRIEVTAAVDQPPGPKAQPFSLASWLRALRTGTAIPEASPVDFPPPALTDTRLSVTPAAAIARGNTIGLLVTIRNTSQEPLSMDLRIGVEQSTGVPGAVRLSTWTWPPRVTILAVMADDEVLGPDGQTRLYVILERRP